MSQQDWQAPDKLNAYQVLRRLHRNSRANIPEMVAQRAMSSFSLQAEPAPHEAQSLVSVVVYPQNPFVSEPEIRTMLASNVQAGLSNSRVQIQDTSNVHSEPDADGNYLYWPDDPRFDQVNAFYYTNFTLRMFERYARRQIPWSFPAQRISVDPHVGDLANAFYNEQEQLLGFHSFQTRSGETHSTAQSADIVAHEAAHAVLDGLRDLQNESLSLGNRAFHESFGDIAAMLVALHDGSLMRRLLDMTSNDLRVSNFVSQVAEHLSTELAQHEDYVDEHTVYLRNAFNTFQDLPFDDLPYNPKNPISQLSRQEHNYSRVFTGAFYDILVKIYEHFVKTGMPYFVALYHARDVAGHLLVMAIELGAVGETNYADMARAFLCADEVLHQGTYRQYLQDVFIKRNILSADAITDHLTAMRNLPEITLPSAINNSLAASMFLESDVLPALNLSPDTELLPLSTYRNAAGNAFVSYFASKRIQLDGAHYGDFDKAVVDMFGGLTLMFDKDNQLRSVCYRPVLEEDERQLRIIIAELIANNRIALDLYPPTLRLRPSPQALHIPHEQIPIDTDKIVKYPVIFDEIPVQPPHLQDYLKELNITDES